MLPRIRARFFPKKPGAILFFIPEGQRLTVQGLASDFGEEDVIRACGADVHVTGADPGTYRHSIDLARAKARSERRQSHVQREATTVTARLESGDAREQERGKLLSEKAEVDERARQLKKALSDARRKASTRGEYMAPAEFRDMERGLEEAKRNGQAIQTRLAQLNETERRERSAGSAERAAVFERAFINAARQLLTREVYSALIDQTRGATTLPHAGVSPGITDAGDAAVKAVTDDIEWAIELFRGVLKGFHGESKLRAVLETLALRGLAAEAVKLAASDIQDMENGCACQADGKALLRKLAGGYVRDLALGVVEPKDARWEADE